MLNSKVGDYFELLRACARQMGLAAILNLSGFHAP